jgi:hypothetical protein
VAKYELEITILPQDVDKRQTLASRIEMTLALTGCRITAGEYVVTIERKSAERIRREEAEAEAEDAAERLAEATTAAPPQAAL